MINHQFLGFFPKIGPQFHGFPQRIDGGIGDLTGIEQETIPVDGVGTVISHSGQEHTTCLSLLKDVLDGPARPIGIGPEFKWILSDG